MEDVNLSAWEIHPLRGYSDLVSAYLYDKPFSVIDSDLTAVYQPSPSQISLYGWANTHPLITAVSPLACSNAVLATATYEIPLSPLTISPVGLTMLANMDTLQVQVGAITAISLSQAQHEMVEAALHLPLHSLSHLPKTPYALVNYFLDWHAAMHALLMNPLPVLSRPLREAKRLLAIFIECLETVVGNILKAIQKFHNERTRAVFRHQMRRTVIFKALHKPLQVIPQSIRPIELAA